MAIEIAEQSHACIPKYSCVTGSVLHVQKCQDRISTMMQRETYMQDMKKLVGEETRAIC